MNYLLCYLGHIYRQQRSCGNVMFSQASAILSTGGVSARHPPGKTPELADTPLGRPPRPDTPGRHPPKQIPRADTPSLGRHHPPADGYSSTAGDGMHPTGMHSC